MSSINACLECRRVKMKCHASEIHGPKCQRCVRKSLECVVREHRRGRKPGTRISKHRADQHAHKPSQSCPSVRAEDSTSTDATANDLQPSGVLNREAMKGRFSLAHLLHPTDSSEATAEDRTSQLGHEDPVALGLINISIARSLFDSFIMVLNPFISQLDPFLHTFTYVRKRSSFLLTAVLTVSAKIFHPIFYQNLYEHSQHLFTNVFRQGSKSAEVVQAILILTYWKEPNDNRVWTSVGYAIRICMELGWHRLNPQLSDPSSAVNEVERREARNIERTWLVLFVYDRSISLQTGKPYMIPSDPLVETAETWSQLPLSIENDRLLGALVTLRLETTSAFTLSPRTRHGQGPQSANISPLLSILDRRIESWEALWTKTVDMRTHAEEESCHGFLIRFYGSHVRLQLFSLQVQNVLSSIRTSSQNLDSLWIAYSSALRMLQLIRQHSSHLNFVQDSVHIMVAYSAAFLVKLLLLAPRDFVDPLEADAMTAIRDAATIFSTAARLAGSSCTLQARFLENIVNKMSTRRNAPVYSTASTGEEQGMSALGLDPPELHEDGFSTAGVQGSDLPFSDSGSWDDIFANAGLNLEDNMFLLRSVNT